MRFTRTRTLKAVILCVLPAFALVQIFGSVARKSYSESGDISKFGSGVVIDPQHKLKLNSVGQQGQQDLNLPILDDNNPSQNRASGKSSEQQESDKNAEDKRPINSLSGERTHGYSNNSGLVVSSSNEDYSYLNLTSVSLQISALNEEQKITNEDIFGPVTNSTLVIVIQVHNRLQYLRHLIVSLSQAKEIEKCLLIFSHDFWDEEINKLIASIDFSKTLQIFYPHSIQTHPNEFPGESQNDCPRNAKKDQAERLQCINADWPDLYGHYREAKFTQTKHHWWWKANRVFDQLRATKNYDGLVLFLEEDHFVAEDFVSSLRLAESIRDDKFQDCDIICIGTYLKSYNYNRDHKVLELTKWNSAKHNMGMAFTRKLWLKIHACRELFCNFDDYNWDWSLEHVSTNCIREGLQVLLFKGPRVFHIGECGVHHKKKTCEAGIVVQKVRDILSRAEGFLYPKELIVSRVVQRKRKLKQPKGNGGWGDLRDHNLCLNMSQSESATPVP